MTATAAKPKARPTPTAVATAVRVPGRDGEPAFVLASDVIQAEQLAVGYRSFYRGVGSVAVVTVEIRELGILHEQGASNGL